MQENNFLNCHIATLVCHEKELRRLADKCLRQNVVTMRDALAMTGRQFWKKFPSNEKTKRMWRRMLKDTGLSFGMTQTKPT